MVKVNTEHTYADMDDSLSGDITVYVDVSVAAERDPKRGKHAYVPSAAGWAIAGEQDVLKGYGVSLIWDDYVKDSSTSELRAILRFLDTLYDHSPEMLVKTNRFNILCDNSTLMYELTEAGKKERTSKRKFSKYGRDYARMVYYMTRTNFSFNWVRGHSTDPFNCLADKMAYKCRNAALSEEDFTGKLREDYIHRLLENADARSRRNHTQKRVSAMEAVPETVVLFPAFNKKCHADFSDAVFIYLNQTTKTLKYDTQRVTQLSKTTISLKTASYSLFNYRMSESFDISRPVLIKSKMSILVDVMNELLAGAKPSVNVKDKNAQEALEELKLLMTGMNIKVVLDLSNTASVMDSIINVISKDYGNVSFKSLDHKERIERCMVRLTA